jgi:Fe-S-cluster containining protein
MEHPATFCLSLHAGYACRHSGACCTAGWTIPIEPLAFERVQVHFGAARSARQFRTGGGLPEGAAAIVEIGADGACMFFESDRGRLCAIHRELGPDALPSACRQFPRIVVQDARSMRISLSHFCPSAAALLQSTSCPTIVAAPPNVDLGGALDGLDARDALPPLLHPRMLMDLEGYGMWESRAIDVLGRDDLTASQAVDTIAEATRAVESWQPFAFAQGPFDFAQGTRGHTTLAQAVERAFDRARVTYDDQGDDEADGRRIELARSSVPAALRSEPGDSELLITSSPLASDLWHLASTQRIVRNYLAARLFGTWIAYHGRGLGAVIEYLRVCLAVLKSEVARHSACSTVSASWQSVIEPAVRSTDLLIVHLSDAKELARLLSLNLR